MKYLLLVQDEQKINLDSYYKALQLELQNCEIMRLTPEEQSNLKRYFKENIKVDDYERIILFLRFKKELKQVKFIQTIPRLVFLEHDACQNYIEGWKYKGKYSQYYSKIPWVRVLVSGARVKQKLCEEGVDACFVPKGYCNTAISNLYLERTINLGFIGGLSSKVYSQRKSILEELSKVTELKILHAKSGEDYNEYLNKIKVFVNADVGLGEYMIKNFEAMAAGCILATWNHGKEENLAIGFKDLENVLLYSSIDELKKKLDQVNKDQNLAEKIRSNGQKLAEEQYTWYKIAQKAAIEIQKPLRTPIIRKSFFGKKAG